MRQREVVVYHLNQNTVVDFIDGQKCYSFSKKMNEKSEVPNRLKFAFENHRMRLRINKLETFKFNVSEKYPNLIYHYGISQFGNYKMAILDNLPQNNILLQVNTVLMHQNARMTIADLQQHFRFDSVIFDGSNARWRVEKWKKECHSLNIPYHDTFEKGAWVKQL